MRFADRIDAGHRLAEAMRSLELVRPVVLGIPRGGVEIGAVLAEDLGAELDVVLARKLRAPLQPELAIGAVAESGDTSVDERTARLAGADEAYIEAERARQLEEIGRRRSLVRGVRPAVDVGGRTVIVVDDGIATGSTMAAALRTLRLQEPREIVVAVPVASPDRLDAIRPLCDRIVCLHAPDDFMAIGQFYRDFEQVPDARVVELLQASTERNARPT